MIAWPEPPECQKLTRRPLFWATVSLFHMKCRHNKGRKTLYVLRGRVLCAVVCGAPSPHKKAVEHDGDNQAISSQVAASSCPPILEPNGRGGRSVAATLPHQLETNSPLHLTKFMTIFIIGNTHPCLPCHSRERLGKAMAKKRGLGSETATPLSLFC